MAFKSTFAALSAVFILGWVSAQVPVAAGAADAPAEEWTAHVADEFLRSFNEDFASGNLEAWMGHWTDDALRESSREQWRGRAAIQAAYAAILADWDRPRLVHERSRMVLGSRLAWQGFYAARHKRTGREVVVPIALFLSFDESGAVRHSRFYLDSLHLMDQVEGRTSTR
jgi:ketosteroid isomerase-like protein